MDVKRADVSISRYFWTLINFLIYMCLFAHFSTLITANQREFRLPAKKTKFILQWSVPKEQCHMYLGPGNWRFLNNNCTHTNCYITANVKFFENVKLFDAIIFDIRDLVRMKKKDFPRKRFYRQRYIFTATDSAQRYPICKNYLGNFFNWTWTYKLNSDIPRTFMTIYDLKNKVVGPKRDMRWVKYLEPIDSDLKRRLLFKSEAAIWHVPARTDIKCETVKFIHSTGQELKKLSSWDIDICDEKGERIYPAGSPRCSREVARDYYFYFVFENYFSDDYVSEQLVLALNNYTVPIVYGAANYSRFLPPGSYLDARKLSPAQLAKKMLDIILKPDTYYDFFRWRNHYKYKQNILSEDICALCEMLNDENNSRSISFYSNIKYWFNGEDGKC